MATNNDLNTGVTPLIVPYGGTSVASTVAYTPLVGGTTSTAALQSVASVGTAGQILTSQGAALPIFQSGFGISPILYTKVTLSAANIAAMRATPVILVAAGGANTLYLVESAFLEIKYNTVAYTGGGLIHIQYDSTINGSGTKATSTLAAASITGVVDDISPIAPLSASSNAGSLAVNKGLYISNATAAFATGNSVCYIHVYYSLFSTTI